MRIGIVLPSIPSYSETFFQSKVSGLQQFGHEVILFVGGKNAPYHCQVVVGHDVNRWKFLQILIVFWHLTILFFKCPLKFLRFLRLEKLNGSPFRKSWENLYLNSHILPYKLDWLHFGFATTSLRRENTARAIGAKMALSFRGYDAYVYPIKHPLCYQKVWDKTDKVHILSEGLLSQTLRIGKPSFTPCHIIRPAVDMTKFPPVNSKKWFDFAVGNKIRFLTVARLHWIKGIDLTLMALSILHNKGIDFKYSIVGDGPEYEKILFVTDQLGISDKIEFIGKLSPAQAIERYQQADIYLQYSLQEGFCNAVLEAQASGLHCIVSDADGLAENIIHNVTGWVVPKHNPQLLADKIEEVLNLDALTLKRVSLQARNRVIEGFNLEQQRQEFHSFYTT